MNVFAEYLKKKWITENPGMLDITRQDQKFRIFLETVPLLTVGGNVFVCESERLARLLVTDMMFMPAQLENRLSARWLYGFQKDVFEPGNDPFRNEWDQLLALDPFVAIKTTGRNNFKSFGPEEELFPFSFISLSTLIRSVNDFVASSMSMIIMDDTDMHPFAELLRLTYDQLRAEQKVVVQALSGVHDSGLVLPLILVTGVISPVEYAKGLISLKICNESLMPEILLDVVRALDYLACLEQRIDAVRPATAVIPEGENDTVEFKSTLRWDIRAGKTNASVERASLKTIAAFLNSAGGTLLIGVRDDGTIEGIESDKFVNEDKFLLHLWSLIRSWLGREVSPYIRTLTEKVDDKTVCLVRCRQSNRPVFLRQPGNEEAFYIRVGPSSNAMEISEALKYIADHFPAG